MQVSPLVIGLVLLTFLAPSVAAAPDPGVTQAFEGDLAVRGLHAYGLHRCVETSAATLHMRSDGVPEQAWFVLRVETTCGARELAFEGRLEEEGWRLGDGDVVRGWFGPSPDGSHDRWFSLTVSTCPPNAVCLYPLSETRYWGGLDSDPWVGTT